VVTGGLVVVVGGSVVVVELGAGGRMGGGAAVGVDVEVADEPEVVGTGTRGKVIVKGEVRIVGDVEFWVFLVDFGADVGGGGAAAAAVVVVGGGTSMGSCETVVVVSLWSLCPASPTLLVGRTARGTCPSRYVTKPKATTPEIKTTTRANASALRLSPRDRRVGMLPFSLSRPDGSSQGRRQRKRRRSPNYSCVV